MAHPAQFEFVQRLKEHLPMFFRDTEVLEIGSLNINGSIRQFFENCTYIGIDVAAGKDVDIVCQGQEFIAPSGTFDVTCSCECFEHNPHWWATFKNMIRMTKSYGLVFFTCATTGRPEHGTTRTSPADSPLSIGIGWEYYKNLTEEDFTGNGIDFSEAFSAYGFQVNESSHDLYFWGVKNG